MPKLEELDYGSSFLFESKTYKVIGQAGQGKVEVCAATGATKNLDRKTEVTQISPD